MTGLVRHLEHFLGPMSGGWQYDADGGATPFQVAQFQQLPNLNTLAITTLGLSRRALKSRSSGKEIHQELLVLMPKSCGAGPVPGQLQQVGRELWDTGVALLRGDVIGPRGPLFRRSVLEAYYVAPPVYFPDEFATCNEGAYSVVFAWLVPVSRREAEFIEKSGWQTFEERLEGADPDLIDVSRESLPL